VVARAGGEPGPDADAAFSRLCSDYWYPVYAWFRRTGKQPADAEDSTQEFLLHLRDRRTLASVDRNQGRFRCFLSGALRYFELNDLQRRNRLKRGGGLNLLSLDFRTAEEWYASELDGGETPDRAFDRSWGEALLARVIQALEAESGNKGDANAFKVLSEFLLDRVDHGLCERIGIRLGLKANGVSSKLARLRRRFRDLVFLEVLRTVADPSQAREEWRHVLTTLAAADLDVQSRGGSTQASPCDPCKAANVHGSPREGISASPVLLPSQEL
jgi:RNA polymerase sigma-70 factor (ECF subfamily)